MSSPPTSMAKDAKQGTNCIATNGLKRNTAAHRPDA
jgi:hypothetical protein